jgi:hypothetical protein
VSEDICRHEEEEGRGGAQEPHNGGVFGGVWFCRYGIWCGEKESTTCLGFLRCFGGGALVIVSSC